MKLNDHFFDRRNKPLPDDSPFRCFNVRCLKCGSLRLILISELNYESGEIAVIHRIASRKNHCCDRSKNFPPREAMDSS
jgi:hypothetical protein